MTVRQWDGSVYDRISAPMEALGRAVLDRLELAGDETVIDAGCGSGRVTEALIERLPRGRVIALDASPSMVSAARERLARSGIGPERVEVREADLLEVDLPGLGLEEPVDAILSTATFHWIADHDLLFRTMRAALRPGGRLVAQCGGEGNIDRLRGVAHAILEREPYAECFRGWRPPWNYAGPDVTRERLLQAGFTAAECWLQPAPQQPEHPRDPFLDTVLAALGEPVVVDYVRLNIDAVA